MQIFRYKNDTHALTLASQSLFNYIMRVKYLNQHYMKIARIITAYILHKFKLEYGSNS